MMSASGLWKNIATCSLAMFAGLTMTSCSSLKAGNAYGCQVNRIDLKTLPDYEYGMELSIGSLYGLSGIYYLDFEDSGFIPEPFIGREHLELQKISAFCVLVAPECRPLLTRRERRALVVEVVGFGRFMSEGGHASEGSNNQCELGTIRIEGILTRKFL